MSALASNAKEIFLEALDHADLTARDRFVAERCAGDAALQRRVMELLEADQESGGLLDQSLRAFLPTDLGPQVPETVGTVIGPYKLMEQIGEGGFGLVFVAEQQHPVRRKVALKIIKPGMNTREVVARFEAERQALALMDHPNIAKVLEAGTTASGLPYFVMELVRGLPITEYCDRAQMKLRERLLLFIAICRAIQHAHQKGIIHRDIKPSNVLVTLHDGGVPMVKVIDFGVAKALNQRLSEHTIYTRHASLVGTPMYMSPEQAEFSSLDIDTRSDVYSLGVLMYELLTGQTPFDKEAFAKVGLDELRRIIREDEPLRPSQRVSTLEAAHLSTIAKRRNVDERVVTRSLRGELDWIVMKALEKDRTRRYGSADGLASDLQAYLDDKPVQACPPSYLYRLQKFVHRKRGVLTTTALLALFAPLAAYGVYALVKKSDPPPAAVERRDTASNLESLLAEAKGIAGVPKPSLNARVPGRYLPGLIPEPPLIPDVGRWQMIPKKPRGRLYSAVWSPDERWIALGETVNVRIYDSATMQLVRVLVGHTAPVFSVAWHPSGERLASAGEDGTIRLWTSDGVPTHLLEGHLGPVYQVAWRPDGERLASVSADGSVRIWNADGSPHLVLDTPHEVVGTQGYHSFCVDWNPDGKLLASGGGDMCPPLEGGPYGDTTVRIWDAETGSLVRKLDAGMKHSVLCVDWRPDGRQLAAGYGEVFRSIQSTDSPIPEAGIRIWSIDGTPGPEIVWQGGSVNSLAWHPDAHRLAIGPYGIGPHFWNADDQLLSGVRHHSGWVYSICWNRDGTKLLTTGRESLSEWDEDGNRNELIQNLRDVGSGQIKWSSDGTIVAASVSLTESFFFSREGMPLPAPERPPGDVPAWWEPVLIGRRPDGTAAPTLEGLGAGADIRAWSKDGWCASTKFSPWNVYVNDGRGKLIATLTGHRGRIENADWSPAGERFVTAGADTLRIWERDGTPGPVMSAHRGEGTSVAWSPDGRWIASGGLDSTIRLWKADGTPGPVLEGQHSGTRRLAWSPDSRRLATRSYMPDTTIRVWNVETGKMEWQSLFVVPNHRITFSPHGDVLHGDRELLETAFLYLFEDHDGSTGFLSHANFWKRFQTSLLKHDMDRALPLARGGMIDEAAAIFDRVTAIDGNGELNWSKDLGDLFLKHQRFAQAACIYSSILKRAPASYEFKRRGAAYMGLKEYDKALADITTAVEMNPGDSSNFTWFPQSLLWESPPEVQEAFFELATKAIALSPANYSVRASYYLHRGDYENARSDLNQLIAAPGTANAYSYYLLAVLLISRQDFEAYRAVCLEMLERFGETRDADAAYWTVWTCTLAPDAVTDYQTAVREATRVYGVAPSNLQRWQALGAVLCRAGRCEKALEPLNKANLYWESTPRDGDSTRAYTWYFLAMAHHALGHGEEAATWLRKADEWTDKVLNDSQEPVSWNRELTLKLLRRETREWFDPASALEPVNQ